MPWGAHAALPLRGDALSEIERRGTLIWGADAEGGGPYVFPRADDPARMTGFEVELADALAKHLGVEARFFQGPWHLLPALLNTGQIDVVLNGYELTPARVNTMEHTRPYYVYRLILLCRRDNQRWRSWDDLRRGPGEPKPKIGVLESSAAHLYLEQHYPDDVEIVAYEGTTDAMREVETGKLDATLADEPAVVYYAKRFEDLAAVGEPVGHGYYVIFMRKDEPALRDALNEALAAMIADGSLRLHLRKVRPLE